MSLITALQAELGRALFMAAVVGLVTVTCLVIASLRRLGAMRTAALSARLGLVVVLAGVGSLTLFGNEPLGQASRTLILDPLEGAWGWDSIAWRPVIDNVTLFVPLGAALAALWCRRSWLTVLVVAALVSVGVEAFQFAFPTGRIANTADVIANTVGAGLGIALSRTVGACPRDASPTR